MISLDVMNMRLEPPGVTREDELIAGVFADLRVSDGPQIYLLEQGVSVLELSRALLRWCGSLGSNDASDFIFDSVFDEDEGLIQIRKLDGRWLIGSALVESPFVDSLTDEEISMCTRRFIDEVIECGIKELGRDLTNALTWNGTGRIRENYETTRPMGM
jgi:hypothetical protein